VNPEREPLPVERLASPDERLTVEAHIAFRESIASPAKAWDEIDELLEEIRKVEFEGKGEKP
jgi:hypothetical protein